jgi:hypothetical protein
MLIETDTLKSGLDISSDEPDFAAELISLLKANAKWCIEIAKELPKLFSVLCTTLYNKIDIVYI